MNYPYQYNMGGAVLQRPLFRQMGGPAQPMPQDMAPAPQAAGADPMVAEQLMNAEAGAMGEAQAMGQEYIANMEARLNAAETPEDVINAMRGNDKPLEARYAELAQIVGEEDAMRTPETVLAMVQPTIMMTEQGALDSGIGELIQNIAGNVEMQGPNGEATAMGGGVGSLMMAGAGNTPPQNFSQGGAVRLAKGGDPLQKYYEQRLPLYQSILGGGEDARNAMQSQALFALSDAAGRFAAGVGAGGQDVRGLSPAAQLAAATTGLGGQLGQIGAQASETERAAKLGALQAAESEYAADRAAARSGGGSRALGDMYDVIVDGKIVDTLPLATQGDYQAVKKQYPTATIQKKAAPKSASPSMVTMMNINDPTKIIAVDQNNEAAYTAAVKGGFVLQTDLKTLDEMRNPDAKPVTLYNSKGAVTFNLADPDQKARYNSLLGEGTGWTADPTLFKTAIEEKSQMRVFNMQQDRQVADQIEKELRDRGYRLEDADRAVLEEIAKEERMNGYKISDEKRQEKIEIARENRAKATRIEQELREQDYAIAAEDRALVTKLAEEERAIGRELNAEERRQRYDELVFERDQEAEIQRELRQQGFIEAAENRDVVRTIAAEERALDRELSKEERAAILEQKRFERDQAATIEAELRQQGYVVNAEDRAILRAIAAEERALGRELSKEERQKKYDQFIFERDQSNAPVKGIPRQLFDKLDKPTQTRIIAGDPKDPQTVKGIPRDIFEALTEDEQQQILELVEKEPSTLTERQQKLLLNTDKINKFAAGALDPQEEAELITVLQSYIAPDIGPQGTSTSKPIPPNVSAALRKRAAAGLDTYGIDPVLFGQKVSLDDYDELTQNIIDQNVDLEAGSGLLSGLANAINYIGEQTLGELGVGTGTLFKETKQAKQALESLSAATRRFTLEGRQLAKELELTLEELPTGAFTTSDAKTLSNIKTQRQLLDMNIQRIEKALETPSSFTSADLSKTRQLLNYAVQLQKAYTAAEKNLGGDTSGKPAPKASDFRIKKEGEK